MGEIDGMHHGNRQIVDMEVHIRKDKDNKQPNCQTQYHDMLRVHFCLTQSASASALAVTSSPDPHCRQMILCCHVSRILWQTSR